MTSSEYGVVLEVLAERTLLGNKEYLVHWACSWEPAAAIEGGEAHQQYVEEKQAKEKKGKKKRCHAEVEPEEKEEEEEEEVVEEEEEEDNILEMENATALES